MSTCVFSTTNILPIESKHLDIKRIPDEAIDNILSKYSQASAIMDPLEAHATSQITGFDIQTGDYDVSKLSSGDAILCFLLNEKPIDELDMLDIRSIGYEILLMEVTQHKLKIINNKQSAA